MKRGLVLGGLALLAVLWFWRGRRADDTHYETGSSSTTEARSTVTPTIVAPVGRRIAGVVVGADGALISGARVVLTDTRARNATVKTDATGAFDFGVRSNDVYVVASTSNGLTGATVRFDSRDAKPAAEHLRLVMYPCDAAIHGTIFDSAGGVVAGARIAMLVDSMRSGAETESGSDGAYELCVPAGSAYVEVRAAGYATRSERVRVYGRSRRDYQLVPGASVVGRVVRAADMSPVTKANVVMTSDGSGTLSAWSDDDGRFEIEGVAPGAHQLRAIADGLAQDVPLDITVELESSAEVRIELLAAVSISGRVVEKGTRTPLGKTRVAAVSVARDNRERSQYAVARDDGSFVIDHLLPGEYQLILNDYQDGPRESVTVAKSDVTDMTLEAPVRGSIAGVVRHDGRPVEGVDVGVANRRAVTAHDGTFLIERVPDGAHELTADSLRRGAFASRRVEMRDAQRITGMMLDLDVSASVSGTVVDQHGAPVAGAFVRFSAVDSMKRGVGTTTDNGAFTTRAMYGGTEYRYEVHDVSDTVFPPAEGARFPRLVLADNTSKVTGLVIRVRVDRLALSGRLVDSAGAPVSDARIVAFYEGARGASGRMPVTTSDKDGAFSLRDLSVGTYELIATSTRAAVTARVTAGTKNLTLRLQAFGSVEGSIEGFSEPVELTLQGWRVSRKVVVNGAAFRIPDLMPGRYQLTARGTTVAAFASVDVRESATTKVAIGPRQMGTIEGIVNGEDGKPVAGVSCTVDDESGAATRHATSDAMGRFDLERVNAGEVGISCNLPIARRREPATIVTVVANQTNRVSITLKPADTRELRLGLTFATAVDEVIVSAVTPGGPGDRAGVRVGDIVETLDGHVIEGSAEWAENIVRDRTPEQGPLRVELQRDKRPFTVNIQPVEKR